MRVKKKLEISLGLSVLTALVIMLLLVVAQQRLKTAMEAAEIAGDIIVAIFERSVFRNDYLQSNSERAKKQWFAKQAQIGKLLSAASRKDLSQEDKLLVGEMVEDFNSVGKLFAGIVATRQTAQPEAVTREVERRLLTQLTIRTYDTVMHARQLQETSRAHLFATIRLAGWSIMAVLAVMVTAVVVSTWNLTRIIAGRVARLREGAWAIGEGNLGYRIDLEGDDEFVELSKAFNGMSAKLHRSQLDLEEEAAERRRAEEALRESEARFRGTFENAAVGIALLDPEGKLILGNGKLCEILGYAEEELQGRFFNSFAHPDDIQPDYARYLLLMKGQVGSYHVEKRYIRKDGSPVWVRVARSVGLDAQGLPAYSISMVQDITTRREAEEKLRESEHRYRTLFNAIDEGFCTIEMIFDDNGNPFDYRFLETNPSFENQTGLSNVKGKTIREFAPEHEEYWFQIYGEIALTGQPARFDNLAEQLGRWYEVYAFRFGEPENRQVAILFNDITPRKQAELELNEAKYELEVRVRERTAELTHALEELRAETVERIQAVEELRQKEQLLIQQSRLAAMGEMLVNISHQWRQPLNVLGLILQEQSRNYRRCDFTGEYLEASVARGRELISHMSRTIDDFRDFFIPEKNKAVFEVKEVVESAFSMVGESSKEMQVDVRVLTEEPVSVEGYRNEFAQAIMNIILNARDVFRERSVVNPRITVKIFPDDGRSVVTISDNAGGIAADVIHKIFDPYFTTKPPDKGTGIGLFMSRTIIEANMKGSLTVRNTGEGAEFRIEV